MPPGGGGGGEHGYGEQEHPPASGHGCRDEETASCLLPPPTPFLPSLSVTPAASEKNKRKRESQVEEQQPAASFPEDVLIEILSQVPYRSLCRFKCVSKLWLALCSDPDIRKKSPQTLSGFFYFDRGWRFLNSSGKGPPMVDPSLPFLRSSYKHFSVTQCSTSVLLCKCWKSPYPKQFGWNSFPKGGPGQCFKCPEAKQFNYVVCNPATQKWTLLPPIELPDQADGQLSGSQPGKYFLGFDPAFTTRFVVFALLSNCYDRFSKVAIYSSETGGWTAQSQWDFKAYVVGNYVVGNEQCVFLIGTMHLVTHCSSIVTMDMEGKTWREIEMTPDMANHYDNASIGQSQGRLYTWYIDNENDCQLSVWVLENYDSGQWTLKHIVNVLELFGRDCYKNDEFYWMFAIHPECNLIFLTDEV